MRRHITSQTSTTITIENASRRKVVLALASDPDISVLEDFNGQMRKKVAIEIKGGTDVSNAHNRAGEAEKSHIKAKNAGFRDFWTIISVTGVNFTRLKSRIADYNVLV